MHPVAQRLLDAQVAFHLEQLRGEQAASTAATFADELLDATADQQIADLVDREVVEDVIARVLAAAPGSPAATGLLDLVVDVAMKGPAEPYPLGELIDRERLEAVLDALVGLSPLVDKMVAQLADSPVVGAAASRFMTRIVAEVANANKAVADKVVPGLGALVSFGTNTAASVVGAAGKPLEGLLGDTMGKSGAFAVRRLGRIVTDTLQDPTTKEAVLQAWDVAAARDISGLGRAVSREQVDEVVSAVQALGIASAASEHVTELVGVMVDRFFDDFGGYTPTELLEQLDLDRTDVRDDVARAAPGVLGLLDEAGVLERLLRARLEPFYVSPEVDGILGN